MADIEADTESSTGSTIEIGSAFDSLSALEEEIGRFQKNNSVQFYIRDSRKIEAAKRRAPHRKIWCIQKYFTAVFMVGKTSNVAAKESDPPNCKLVHYQKSSYIMRTSGCIIRVYFKQR